MHKYMWVLCAWLPPQAAGVDPSSPREQWPLAVLQRAFRALAAAAPHAMIGDELWCGAGGAAHWWERQRAYAQSTAAVSMVRLRKYCCEEFEASLFELGQDLCACLLFLQGSDRGSQSLSVAGLQAAVFESSVPWAARSCSQCPAHNMQYNPSLTSVGYPQVKGDSRWSLPRIVHPTALIRLSCAGASPIVRPWFARLGALLSESEQCP